jgi:hypothetical protein
MDLDLKGTILGRVSRSSVTYTLDSRLYRLYLYAIRSQP